jgi:MYXO-CTERM domain-containing protein
MLLTVGLPAGAFALRLLGRPALAALTPPGAVYSAQVGADDSLGSLGLMAAAGVTLFIAWRARRNCDRDLRAWYDRSHGQKVLT